MCRYTEVTHIHTYLAPGKSSVEIPRSPRLQHERIRRSQHPASPRQPDSYLATCILTAKLSLAAYTYTKCVFSIPPIFSAWNGGTQACKRMTMPVCALCESYPAIGLIVCLLRWGGKGIFGGSFHCRGCLLGAAPWIRKYVDA